jgi:superfamily II DNA or RNA helicase
MCGTVSFKRGDAFFRAKKVTFEHYSSDHCEAIVTGKDHFHVTIDKEDNGNFRTKCSCPVLASFQKDCQHIAAVLLAINDHQRHGTTPALTSLSSANSPKYQELTEGLLTIFNKKPILSSGQQLHFENRQVLDLQFTCKPVDIGKGNYLLGMELKIGTTPVIDVRKFLDQVKEGNSCLLSKSFTYNPKHHCFKKEANTVIQQLIQGINDEKIYVDTVPDHTDFTISPQLVMIAPSYWERLKQLLTKVPMVKLEYDGNTFNCLHLVEEPLPLGFSIKENGSNGFQLKINGLNRIIVLKSYHSVLSEGKIISLKSEDCIRLAELKQMLDSSGTNVILVPTEEIDFFLDKVVPGLKRLGDVQLSEEISKQFSKTPLIAKLYLDRVKNRLLAGLEFHYENFVINPLDGRELNTGTMFIRDVEKENEILQLMKDGSFGMTDGGYFLHNEELEYEFLYHVVPKLQNLLQIYATTAVRNRIFRESARPQVRIKVKKERTNWLEFKFEMDGIPEKQIRDVLLALEEKRKYFRLRNGSLLSLETREFEEIQRFLKALPVQNEDLESGLNFPIIQGLKLMESVEDGNVFALEESFRQFLEDITNPGSLDFEVPYSLELVLRDYQKRGYKWMKTLASYGFGGILADDMGLGKTLQSITFILSELSNIRKRKLPVLIVCPSSVTYNWLSEIMKFAPEVQALVVDGNKAERVKLQEELSEIDVLITSYPLLRKDILWFEKQSYHTVLFDEAQAFKNPVTQTAKAVKRIQADYRFALTGTPVENSIEELWSIFHVVFPQLFHGLKEYSNLTTKTIARRIRPFLLRRLKEDVLAELPEKIEFRETVELLPEQKRLYAAYLAKLRHETLKHLDKDSFRKNRIKILAGITRLRQICCHPALFVDGYKGKSAKLEQLMQIIQESNLSGRRVLIFSQFTKMLELIGRELALQGQSYFYLDGQTPSEERVTICNRFNEGERDLFLISLKAGGTGLNLTGADTVILYDIWWNPAVEEQAADRAHRMGQTNIVQVIKLVTRGTIEEKMNELQERKRNLIEDIIRSDKKVPSTLTEEDIRDILMI